MSWSEKRRAVAVLAGLTCVLAYTVFQWGGVVRTGRYESLMALGLLAVVSSFGLSRGGWTATWTAALIPAYVLLQAVPLPLAALRVLSPMRAEMVESLGPIGAKVSFAPLSVFPAGTFQYFLLVCAYLTVFLLAREATWRLEERGWAAVWPIVALAALEAGLGLWQYFGGPGAEEQRRGTYANRNHYAGFLEMALPFAVMYPVAVLRRVRQTDERKARETGVGPYFLACGVWAVAGVIFAGTVHSFSRMGFTAALVSLGLMAVLALGRGQLAWVAGSRERRWAAGGVAAAVVLGGFLLLPPNRLIQRFAALAETDGMKADGRTELWAETIPLIRAYPWFGCGLGGYETAFLRFKVSGPMVTDDYAHNDYLQLAAELGAMGLLIAAALAFAVTRKALRGAVESSEPEGRYFSVACAGALAAILLHSMVDFNLYIPANAMLLAWIAGMTMGQSFRGGRERSQWRPRGVIHDVRHITDSCQATK